MSPRKDNKDNFREDRSPWEIFLDKLKKDNPPYYDLLKESQLDVSDDLIIYVANDDLHEKVNHIRGKIQVKLLTQNSHWNKKKLYVRVDRVSNNQSKSKISLPSVNSKKSTQADNPLQELNHAPFYHTNDKDKALHAAVAAEKNCKELYKKLSAITEKLAPKAFNVEFSWRVRVGGMQGFHELLLPVFHPVYGVPYFPASSLKGLVRAWATQHKTKQDVERLFGTLEGGIGCVQFLDAFPTKPCLSVDMANPQWHWQKDNGRHTEIKYKSEPHVVLSMLKPTMKIGLTKTSKGTDGDVGTVIVWAKKALATGIGSRVSSGYGRTKSNENIESNWLHSSHEFKLWSQGMYGANPPAKHNNYQGEIEFRPSAVRGMLRYWFRAFALGIYSLVDCKNFESELFGTIEPRAKEGKIRIAVDWIPRKGDRYKPHYYSGKIHLEAKEQSYLTLIEKLLQLSSHLAGIGRGSRRPLHWNEPHPGLRGCYWELAQCKLAFDGDNWEHFFEELRNAFIAIQLPSRNINTCPPGSHRNRGQDVLNQNAEIYLVPNGSVRLKHPAQVNNWQSQGSETGVRGRALDILYQPEFKGEKKDRNRNITGNRNVGGAMETPSYITIQSNFPENEAYQAVTVFGSNHPERQAFINALPDNKIKVF